MQIDADGLAHLEAFETCALTAYWDENGWALGYGQHNPSFNSDSTCTLQQAKQWIAETTGEVSARLSELITVVLNQGQFNALVIFAYNIGVNAFASSHLFSGLNSGNLACVPAQISRWIYTGGKVNAGLVARRASEVALWTQASETQTNQLQAQEENAN